ncbi:MAG TPA: hypothetical protein VF147_09560 [Vicinamibacterales bacterium]
MRVRIGVGILAVIIATATGAAAQAKPQMDADARELAAYRLTMESVNKVAAATRAMAVEMKKDPRYQEAMKLDADIKALEKKDELTDAEDTKLQQMKEKREQLSEALDDGSLSNSKSLSEMAAAIEKFPPMANGLRAAGMTPREYAKFMMAMLQASMVAGFKKSGMMKESDIPKEVNLENVRFIEEHQKELEALQKELQGLGSGGGH